MTNFGRTVRTLFSSASANALAVGANQGALILTGVIIAQMLGRDAFGRFSLLLVTLQVFASLGQLSLGVTATKFVAELRASSPQIIGRVVSLLVRVSIVLAGVITLLLLALSGTIHERVFSGDGSSREILLLAPAAALLVFVAVQSSAIAGFEAYTQQAKISWLGALCTLVMSTLLANFLGVAGALLGITCGLLFRAVASAYVLVHEVRRLDTRQVTAVPNDIRSRLVSYAVPAALAGITAFPATWLAAAALTHEPDGLHSYAAYAAAFNVKSLMLFIPAIITAVTVPRLSFELASSRSQDARRTFAVAVLTSVISLGLSATVILVGLHWVLAAFGSEFSNATPVLRLVIFAGVLEGASMTLYSLFQARGQLWLPFAVFSVPRDAILVACAFMLCPKYGAVGLGGAALISSSYTIAAVLMVLAVRERARLFRPVSETNS